MAYETKQSKQVNSASLNGEEQSIIAEEQSKFLETLRHQRHDWLNHFQVLMGYLKLKRYELCEEYIKKVTESTNNDSRIAAIGYDPLVSYLFTYNALYNEMKLEIEMPELIRLDRLPEEEKKRLYDLVRGTIEIYRTNSKANGGSPNSLVMLIQELGEALYISAEFEGHLDGEACIHSLRALVGRFGNEEGFFVEGIHNNDESIMEFYFPLSVNKR